MRTKKHVRVFMVVGLLLSCPGSLQADVASLLVEVEKTKALIARLRVSALRRGAAREDVGESRLRDFPVTESQYPGHIRAAARKHGIDPALVQAVIDVESGGDPLAVSPKGARGLMQVMPETAAEMGVSPRRLFDPQDNVTAGTRYLAEQVDRFHGELPKALAAYNAGPGAVLSGQPLPRETRLYVPRVLARYRALKE